eukprot:TRINITY_DN43086_c0_g1_i1.p1 TRINITY_DN43086_c0_g1~~TRINITY_DN43086_c0_g1_i1.p1  ORF type:complete len:241 (-),score=58.99 TRINITY_DN43086_c0_g1_i1:233-955(-)
MAADTTALKAAASKLEVMTTQLMDEASKIPDALVRPALDRLGDQKQVLYDIIGEMAQKSAAAEASAAPKLERVFALEAELAGLVDSQWAELDAEGGPWHNPAALRRFRDLGQAISRNISELKHIREDISGRPIRTKEPLSAWPGLALPNKAAPSMASGSLGARADRRPGARDTNMSVEEALNMLVEKKDPIWKGSLVGIVHAAGVQELTPITSHLPGRFEFVYAPKMQAAWNLHCNSAMI